MSYKADVSTHPRQFTYTVDDQNCIRSLSGDWDAFAHCNHATIPRCSESSLVGKLLLDFIQDKETKHLYELIFEKVRTTRTPVLLPFHYDAPEEKRFMELRISPLREGWLEFTSTILRTETRDPLILLKCDIRRSENFVKLCSMCKKVCVPDGKWMEIEDAVAHLQLFNAVELPQITHGLCPECTSSFVADFQV